MTTGIGNAVGVRRTETSLIVWESPADTGDSGNSIQGHIEANQEHTSLLGADTFYDAGNQGCAEGPLDKISALMQRLEPGQTLEVRATDPSVVVDLPAWCRMVGHKVLAHNGDRYLIEKAA